MFGDIVLLDNLVFVDINIWFDLVFVNIIFFEQKVTFIHFFAL